MVIKRSSAREVSMLLEDLESGQDGARDAAVARLAVIGTRAVEGLLSVARAGASPATRSAAFAALEAIADPRVRRRRGGRPRRPGRGCGPARRRSAAACSMPREGPRSLTGSPRSPSTRHVPIERGSPRSTHCGRSPAPVLDLLSARLKDDPSPLVRASVLGTSGAAVLPRSRPSTARRTERCPTTPTRCASGSRRQAPRLPSRRFTASCSWFANGNERRRMPTGAGPGRLPGRSRTRCSPNAAALSPCTICAKRSKAAKRRRSR